MLDFNEANVLEAIVKVSNYHNLGSRLGISANKLADIERSHIQDRRQLFVAALFRNAPKESLNWEAVNRAIREVETREWAATQQPARQEVETLEWATQQPISTAKSTSMESEHSLISAGM